MNYTEDRMDKNDGNIPKQATLMSEIERLQSKVRELGEVREFSDTMVRTFNRTNDTPTGVKDNDQPERPQQNIIDMISEISNDLQNISGDIHANIEKMNDWID